MLEDFKDNKFYDYAINLKKYYHAYIFEVDDVEKSFSLILAFSKMIICKNHYHDNKNCKDCNICHLIDNKTYSDLKILEPDGSMIKKDQILDLQKSLSLKSSNDTNQVYIIKYAEKMNLNASNSLLKFIEEPENGIYGILITTNRKELLSTINSRCILISLKNNNEVNYEKDDLINITNFINLLYKRKEDSIAYLKCDFFKFYDKREDILKAFDLMEFILDTKIKLYYQKDTLINPLVYDIINSNLNDLDIFKIIKCLDKVIEYKNKLLNVIYVNLNLLMDRFVIDLFGVIK